MDCSVEESQIRRALEPLTGIQALNFQLGARTLAITAPESVVAQAVQAIRRVGFEPRLLAAVAQAGTGPDRAHGDGHAHDHDHDHDHKHNHEGVGAGLQPLLIALGLALAAEAVAFFAGTGTVFTLIEMGLALGAIWFAGFDTYQKGLIALRHGRLNINALMTVAVTA